MKISNVTILSTDLANNTAKISFTISEATENVNIYLKINNEEYKVIFLNKANGNLEYTTKVSRGVNNLLLKATDSTTEYISEPIQVLLKEEPSIKNLECSYSDSTGKYILNFTFNGDTNFKYNIYLKLDVDDYIEVLSNQISGDKTIEQTSTMGNHTCILKVSDGYDDYTFSSFQFEITNRKPILSKVLVTDITNNGEAYIYYATKDIESSTLTHKLTIGTTETVISPTQVDNFYSYRITGLSEGISNCTISISDGIDVISSDIFSIEVFSDTTDKKELLRRAKVRYDSAYQQLRDIIVSVISDLKYDYDIENALIAKAQDNYKIEYSNFNKISQQSIDTIGSNKVKVTKQELQSEINDIDSAVNGLETTMWGVFQDGILDQSERDTLSGSLDLVAKEKIDIDKDYEVLYNNEDLLDPSKTKLQTNYNNFIEAHNSLVTTINNIINKEGIIDNTDKTNIDTAFENWRTALGNYRVASLEAIDAIAKKKADDSADVVDKKWAEIVLDPETGIKSQVGSLQSKITGAGGIEERLKTAEQTITTDGISNIVKDVYYTKTEVDNKVTNVDNKIKVTVKSVNVMYYLSTSTTELSGGTWTDVAPTWEANKYMWSKTVTTLSDGTIKESSPTCIAGAKGQDGVPGKDGKTTYTWIKYADDENGNGISNNPTNKSYIGFAYNKTTNIESNSPSDYTWSLIKGADGADGQDGKDGTSVTILGSYNSVGELNQAHPNNNNNGDGYIVNGDLYIWDGKSFINVGQIKGEDGKNGVDGQDGKNGLNAYVHIKYSNDGGKTFTPSNGEEVGDYLGIYTDYYEADSTDVTKYTWSKIKGQDGVNGTTYYTWIKYSDNANGSNMYDTPKDSTKYIGIATNKTTKTESTDPTAYTWSKFRGEDGTDGVPGTNGKDGVTTYTWIKYADDSNGNGISNNPTGKEYIGFAYNKTTATESNVPSDYMWSLIKGTDGIDGTNGVDGVTYYTWIKYSDNADGTGLYDTPNSQTKYIGIATNKTTATESTNKTDYVWSKFRGEDGTDGKGVTSIVNYYRTYTSDKGLTNASSGFSTTVPTMDSTNKYLWSYELITYTDNSSAKTSARVIGMYSTDGTNGRGISSITEYYAVGTSNTTAPTNFSTKIPTMDSINKYLWNYEVITYTDNTTKTTDKRVIGVYGETGATGTGIESITEEYYLSTSKTTQTGGSWVTTPPTWEYGKYVWTRSKIVYKDPASTVYTTPMCDSSWEAVNEIEIGGRNLASEKNISDATVLPINDNNYSFLGNTAYTKNNTTANENFIYVRNINVEPNTEYTISFYAKKESNCKGIDVFFLGKSSNYTGSPDYEYTHALKQNIGTTTWTKYSYTFTTASKEVNGYIRFDNNGCNNTSITNANKIWIAKIKMEKGNKATDWTPAPEDIQSQIDFNKAEIKTTKETVAEHTTSLNSITSRVSATESTITTIQNKVNIAIKEVYTMYYLSTSSTQLIDGAWSRDVPSDISYNYLWTKTVTVYVNGTTSESDPICNTAMNGEDGEPGYTVILSDETFIVQCDLNGDPL